MTRQEIGMIREEVRRTLKGLGYTGGKVGLRGEGFHRGEGYSRLVVTLDGERIGIYDLHKQTFVD